VRFISVLTTTKAENHSRLSQSHRANWVFIHAIRLCAVVCLPGPEKGVDDFIMSRGIEAFDALYQAAQLLSNWQARSFTSPTHLLQVNRAIWARFYSR